MSLHLLYTCFSRSWGGLEMHSLQEAKLMRARGYRIWMACCAGSRLDEESQREGIAVLPFRVNGYFHPLVAGELVRFIRSEGISLVHCQQSKDLAVVTPSVYLSGRRIPVILSKRVGSFIRKRTLLHRFIYSTVARVLAISEVIRRNVIETTPMEPERVVTMHHGIDTVEFSPGRADGKRVRGELGITAGDVVVGLVGRFSPGKGHEDFLSAVSLLSGKQPGVRYLIVGEASHGEEEYEGKIRKLSSDSGLDSLVTFTGFRRDVRDVMDALDIFAFPSHAEAFGAVLIEAMALEKPVVSTNCDGVLDIVVDGETGLYVSPGKPAELADAIGRLIADPALRERLGKAGRRRVLEQFDSEKMIERIEGIYHEVLGEERSRS